MIIIENTSICNLLYYNRVTIPCFPFIYYCYLVPRILGTKSVSLCLCFIYYINKL